MFYYRLFNEDGSEVGDHHYVDRVELGETIWTRDGRRVRVVKLIPTNREVCRYTGLLMVVDAGETTVSARAPWPAPPT